MQGIVSSVLELHQNQQKMSRLCIVQILWQILTTKNYFCYGKRKNEEIQTQISKCFNMSSHVIRPVA